MKTHRVLASVPIDLYVALRQRAEKESLSDSRLLVKALNFYIHLSEAYGRRMPPHPVAAMATDPRVVNEMHDRWHPFFNVDPNPTIPNTEIKTDLPIKRFRPVPPT